jgi:hypothetical protein
MPALLTVHGTFATGPLHGEKWWQIESEFEKDIRKYVQSSDGELRYIPVPWDGHNSETSRRQGGRKLLQEMLALEKAGEPYAVIGHSHGGSVIALALLEAANRRQTLNHLQKWITVGTPFIALRKERLLFSRVSYFGKSTIVTLASLLLLFGLAFYYDQISGVFNIRKLALLVTPFAIVYGIMLYFNNFKFHIHRKKNWDRFKEHFSVKWIALNHHDDEAIGSLSAMGRVKLELFDKRFAEPPLTFLGAVLVPVLLLVLVLSPSLMEWFEWMVGRKNSFEGGNEDVSANVEFIADRMRSAAQSFANYVHPKMEFFFAKFSDGAVRAGVEAAFSLVTLMIIPVIAILALAYALVLVIGFLSIGVSSGLSNILNKQVRSQIQATAYGNDSVGEIAYMANKTPFGLGRLPLVPLPDELAKELSEFSDAEAIKSLPKLRGVLKNLALSEGGAAEPDMISQYLSGYELIHTSYFRLSRFRKLVACALASCNGFEASKNLTEDADYRVVDTWQGQLNGKRPPSTSA